MATIPTIPELYASIKANLESKLNVVIALFGKSFLNAFSANLAAKLKLFYLFAAKIQKNIFIDTADSESIGGTLERFGRVWLSRDPFPATTGTYICDVTGTNGATVTLGLTIKTNDDSTNPGEIYTVIAATAVASGTGTITIESINAGEEVRQSIGDELTFTAPISDIDPVAIITTESTAPLAAEDLETYRRLAIESVRIEGQGGSKGDYKLWAADVAGLRTVYPYVISGEVGTINLFAESLTNEGIPTPAQLTELEEVVEQDPDTTRPLNERSRRPMGAFEIFFLPITNKDVDIEITGLLDDTPAIRSAITSAIEDFLLTVRPFVAGVDDPNTRKDILYVSDIITTINNTIAVSNNFTEIELKVETIIVSSQQFLKGDIPKLNSITYV